MSVDWRDLELFRDVPTDSLGEVVRHFAEGEALFQQGHDADGFIVLLHGRVMIEADGIPVAERGAGEIIGEQAIIDKTTRSATVRALGPGPVEAVCFPARAAEKLMALGAFQRNLLKIVSEKLRASTIERAYHYRIEKLLFSEFRAHLAPEVIDELLRTGVDFGAPRFIEHAVILFSDIRGFTERSRDMDPADLAGDLSAYFEPIVDLIHGSGGLVDKFIGDAVMAVWGYSLVEPDMHDRALICAADMVRLARGTKLAGDAIEIGVGLNCGRVFVGNVGSTEKRQFTVLGGPVNTAARCEGLSKELPGEIVLTDCFVQHLTGQAHSLEEHRDIPVRGVGDLTLFSLTVS